MARLKKDVELPKDTEQEVVESTTQEIPDYVDKILKTFDAYSALYVDDKGGVYQEDAQPDWVKDAILYQNPYYKQ